MDESDRKLAVKALLLWIIDAVALRGKQEANRTILFFFFLEMKQHGRVQEESVIRARSRRKW